MSNIYGCIAAVLLTATVAGADDLLLSDNPAGNAFDSGVKRIATGAALTWITPTANSRPDPPNC